MVMDNSTLLLPGGTYGVPSVFFYSREEGILIGEDAEDAGQGTAARFLKREIKLALDSEVILDGKRFTAEDIVSYMLKYIVDIAAYTAQTKLIVEDAENAVEGAVISIPAAFKNNEKELIRRALERSSSQGGAGCRLLGFIKEPVAAALSYFNTSLEDQTAILVFDLGGGTCDVAIVMADSRQEEKYVVVDSEMIRVGGRNWDQKISAYLTGELQKRTSENLTSSAMYQEKIRQAAVNAKHGFSVKDFRGGYKQKVTAHVDIAGSRESVVITQAMFDELTRECLNKTIELVKKVIARNPGIHISKMVCVGGGSNMPQVIQRLQQEFPRYDFRIYEPEKAIALGAAIYAQHRTAAASYVRDIAAFSYGIRCYDDYDKDPNKLVVMNLIKKGKKLPERYVRRFFTVTENQETVTFYVFESDNYQDKYDYNMRDEDAIMHVAFHPPKNAPKGYCMNVELLLTQDGLLEIHAKDQTGQDISTQTYLNF